MEPKKLIELLFLASLSGMSMGALNYIKTISEELSKLTANVVQLNTKIELLADRMLRNDVYLKDHEERLRTIEYLKKK